MGALSVTGHSNPATITTADQDSLRGFLIGANSSREELDENLSGNIGSSSQRLEATSVTNPTTHTTKECALKPAPPRSLNISREYNSICKTHQKLVKSGAVTCSVSLSDTPPTVDLPPAPRSPCPVPPQLQGSVHWGAVGDFSGVQTPATSPAKESPSPPLAVRGVSVIQSAPPALLPRSRQFAPPDLPPRSSQLKNTPHSLIIPRNTTVSAVPRRLSSTDPQLLENRKIPIVSTSVSSLDSDLSVFKPDNTVAATLVEEQSEDSMSDMDDYQDEARKLLNIRRRIVRRMDEFTVEHLNTSRLTVMERDLDRISDMKDDYQDGIEDFIDKFRDLFDGESLGKWTGEVTNIANEVIAHADKLRTRAAQISAAAPSSANSDRSLQIQEATLRLQELSLSNQKEASDQQETATATRQVLEAENSANTLLGECSVLGDMMGAEVDWTTAEEDAISSAMRSLEKWQEQMNTIERTFRNFENSKGVFTPDRQEAIQDTYDECKEKFQTARSTLRKEDAERGLYTLEPARSDIIKYPFFTGSPSEDFLKFMETMQQRFKENKVKKKEQVAKLRECLKGSALGRVPDGIVDIEEAFRRLKEAFGNPSKVMNYNLKALEDLGTLPPEKMSNGHFNYAKRIEWFLKLEVILGKILDLSERSSKLAHEAFSSSTYRKIWALFPTGHIQKLVKVQGEDEVRMRGILSKIVEMREQSQVMDDECGSTASAPRKKTDPPKVTADLFFKQPERYEECRVCVHLSSTSSSHPNLFEDHLSNYATGCPKFMEATTEVRKTLVKKTKICPQCFHPEVIFHPGHLKTCTFAKKKNKYSCTEESCKDHMWICLLHKHKNKAAMEQFRKDMQRKGLSLTFTTYIPLKSFQTNTQELNSAVRKVTRGEKKKGREIVPVPSGEPMFLFHNAQGKTKPVKTFYDTGCSHAVFKDGIPGQQLRGQLVTRGPFNIGGVGGLTTTALDEWVVTVTRTDGKKQMIQGLTVPKVTSDFPMTNLVAAVKEIKEDDPSNETLQNCKVPTEAGGSVDMLLGIKFLSVFPKEVHTLTCGLTIYRSRLTSHGGEYDSCIGGPHSSFTALTGLAGGAAELLGHFIDGLKVYRQWGPPSIKSIAMTEDDIVLAKKFNAKESGLVELTELNEVENDSEDDCDDNDPESIFSCCSHCPRSLDKNLTSQVAQDERISEYKRFQEMQELGLDVEYRCPDCRDCVKCKKADKTEKVSLREESEDFEVKKSITLDFENKKIQSTLPLRGKERDFLCSNRDKARKILMQQCKKYHGDSETKEVVLKAFAKLFDNGHAVLLSQLSEEQLDQFINKEVQYHIPWRVVFSDSPTTPCRAVMDASSRTSYRSDKTGGRCLNDLVCKGKIETLNLVKVLLRFVIGRFALTGDLQQFYNACKLTSEQWNLQRFLWIEDLDPNGQILEAVITTLIYGVKSVSAQTEFALSELAEHIRNENPKLALFLVLSRYVDDLMDSKGTKEECLDMTKAADELFDKVGLICKGWNYSGSPPSPKVSKDGLSVGVGGFGWFPEGDILELKIPKLHFGKARRGRVADSVKLFEGTEDDMDNFVPEPLSRRQVASKLGSLWDILGKLAPLMNGFKLDLREVFQNTESWDDGMPADLRQKWVKNFWVFEQLRGMKFSRAVMPAEAVDSKLRLLTGVDAAQKGLMMGCWGGFKLRDGTWSNQLILGRAILARNDSIPKSELEALCGGSNMAWVIRLALQDWVESAIVFSDSMIALCWLTSEKLRLSLFHRNRVLQIRRGTEMENVFHVKTEYNPADCGTRPSKVKISDVGPDSRWENGDSWMKLDIDMAVSEGYIKPATELRVSDEMEDTFKDGLMFGDQDEILTRGHTAATVNRIEKIEERAKLSDYLLLPTKYKFGTTVRIYGYVMCFVTKARKGRKMLGQLLREAKLWFSTFASDMVTTEVMFTVKVFTTLDPDTMPRDTKVLRKFTIKKLVLSSRDDQKECLLTDSSLHLALLYLFRKGSNEVRHFTSKKVLSKISHEVDGILLSKVRMLDGMNFSETGEFGDFNLGGLGIKVSIPVLERYSPLSYSIAQHVHWNVGRHRGIETTNRLSLEHVSIMQGMTLYREIAEECIRCHMKRKKLLEVPMGPVAKEQLVIAPPFFVTMVDLFGPMRSFVPGFERHTRGRRELETKVHVLVSVCITTKTVNLQALEGKDASAVIDGFTRLCSEVGIPSIVHVDQDSGALAGFRSAELDFRDLQHQLHKQFGISFTTCPVGGHDQHGLVEATIKSIQETFEECGLKTKRIHALGWQTFCKLAENAFNNLPIGYSYARDQDNTELLKILTPNMLRVGRINSRALQGPIRLPVDKKELLEVVETTYKGWFKIFKETVVPRLIRQPKWFKIDRDLKEQDLVYFQKKDSPLNSTWTIGQVDQVIVSRDGVIRRAVIKYFNPNENHPQFTDRSVRKMVKLWSLDEACLFDDLADLQRRYDRASVGRDVVARDEVANDDIARDDDTIDEEHAEAEALTGMAQYQQTSSSMDSTLSSSLASEAGLVLTSCPAVYSVLGHYCGAAQARQIDGPTFSTLDGVEMDLAALAISCDLTPLTIGVVEEDQAHCLPEQEEQAGKLDSLHEILVSTGFYLE